jgi:hypothetical protein
MPSAKELREIAKDLKIRGYSKFNKTQLTEAIENRARSEKDDDSDEGNPKLRLKEPSEASSVVRGPDVRKGRTSTSPWVEFCRQYSKDNGCTYKEAMSKRDEYLTWKEKKVDVAGNEHEE